MGGRREVSIISDRPVTRSDLKQERSFFRGSVSTFLQLIVAIPLPRANYVKNSFSYGGSVSWNSLPVELRQARTLSSLKHGCSDLF